MRESVNTVTKKRKKPISQSGSQKMVFQGGIVFFYRRLRTLNESESDVTQMSLQN